MIKFEEMGLIPGFLNALQELDFDYPILVQEK
jgi:hypothetical protein